MIGATRLFDDRLHARFVHSSRGIRCNCPKMASDPYVAMATI
jgi:hypothetical protein